MPWSKRSPDGHAPAEQMVALRAALRAFPGLADLSPAYDGTHAEEDMATVLITATRSVFVAWTDLAYEGVDPAALDAAADALRAMIMAFDAQRPGFYGRHRGLNEYHIGAMEEGMDCARRAPALVSWALGGPLEVPAQDRDHRHIGPRQTLSLFGPSARDNLKRWSDAQLAAEARDRHLLAWRVETPRSLAMAPLWPNRASEALAVNLIAHKWASRDTFALLALSLCCRNVKS